MYKVYLVFKAKDPDEQEWGLQAIFSSRELATAYIENHRESRTICPYHTEVWRVDNAT